MEMKKSIPYYLLFITYYLLTACTTENYESGDGKYSYLRADFVEVHTAAPRQIDYALADNGERITFSTPFAVQWTEKADTFYRALLYYDRRPDGNTPVSLQRIYVLQPRDVAEVKSPKFDPVTFESTWLSRCQLSSLQSGGTRGAFYINLSFLIKTGQADDENAVQSIGIVSEQAGDTLHLTLLHDQGSVPQYYSTRVYTSIPVSGSRPTTLTVNTYDGKVTRQIIP